MKVIPFPSDEWIKALSEYLNASEAYEKSAKDWEGDFVFVVEGDELYPHTAHLFLGLYHGKSTGAGMSHTMDDFQADYVIRAPFKLWRRVIEGRLDPIQGMMTKQLKLTGNMMMIMRYPKAAKEIVMCTTLIPTDFGTSG